MAGGAASLTITFPIITSTIVIGYLLRQMESGGKDIGKGIGLKEGGKGIPTFPWREGSRWRQS